jgi:hypothetical protein
MDKAREESLGHYEMLWDCSHCDTKKLLGKTHRFCPNCGAVQDGTKRYFPSDADKVKVENHVFTGGDKKCASCGTAQSSKAKNCGNCGAPLSDAASVPLVTQPKPVAKKSYLLWYIIFGVVVFCVLIWFMCIRKKTVEMTVTGHRWAATQEIEEYREVTEEAWKNEVPTGARQVSCIRKQRSTKQVPDGEDCKLEKKDKGDGTFEEVQVCKPRYRSEGIDDDFCNFRIDRWTVVETLKNEGKGVEQLAWPVVPTSKVQSGIGARRAGKKAGVYTIDLNDGKNNRTCDVGEGTWKKYKDGQKVKAKVRAQSGSIVCSEL